MYESSKLTKNLKDAKWSGKKKVVREDSFIYEGLLWLLLSGKNENQMNPV